MFITKLSENENISNSSEQITRSISFEHAIPTGFGNLPIRVLTNTFKYIPIVDLKENIIPVCAHWRYAALRPQLWKSMKITKNKIPLTFVYERIRNFTELETLHLENLKDPNPIILQACRCLTELKTLKVRHCSSLRPTTLFYIISSFKKLQKLDLSRTELDGFLVLPKLGFLRNLKSLNLSHIPNMKISNIMDAVMNCHYLEELKISCLVTPKVYLNDEDASFMVTKLSDTLKSLSIDASSLTNVFYEAVCECSNLERLCLYSATNLTGDVLLQFWKHFPNWIEFKLRHAHHVSSNDIKQLFLDGRNILKNLTLLDLTGCWKLNDSAIEAIINTCTNLISLTLKGCKQVTIFSIICTALQELTYLNLAYCMHLARTDIFELPPKLQVFVTHRDEKIEELLNYFSKSRNTLKIYIAKSEYNKELNLYRTKFV